MPDAETHPVRLDLNAPLEIEHWRPLVHWLLAIPHLIIAGVLRSLRQVLQLIALFAVLFTRRIPHGLFDMIVLTIRYGWRAESYALWMRRDYPPFDFTPGWEDPGGDPALVSVDYPEELQRWLPLVKWFLAIPHYLVLVFLHLGAVLVGMAAFFAVLFTGRYPEGMRSYLIGVNRWSLRVLAYAGFLRDEYPPFTLA